MELPLNCKATSINLLQNPQVDIQAQDRCHRIGQTKPVMIYSLVTKNTIDETVIHRGTMKRRLEKAVIKDGE